MDDFYERNPVKICPDLCVGLFAHQHLEENKDHNNNNNNNNNNDSINNDDDNNNNNDDNDGINSYSQLQISDTGTMASTEPFDSADSEIQEASDIACKWEEKAASSDEEMLRNYGRDGLMDHNDDKRCRGLCEEDHVLPEEICEACLSETRDYLDFVSRDFESMCNE